MDDSNELEELLNAIKNDNTEQATELINIMTLSSLQKHYEGYSVLDIACIKGNKLICDLLKKKGNINLYISLQEI
jgi:hypothetical protein